MPICEIQELKTQLHSGARICGIDLGDKTIGLALSDPGHIIASPLKTLKRTKFRQDASLLFRTIEEYDIGAVIIGLPKNMDGSEGPRCQSTRQFAANLIEAGYSQPISFWDERLSTVAVERVLVGEADVSRKKRSEAVDKMAAAFILQGALDRLRQV